MLGQQQGYMSIKCRKMMEGRITTIGKLMEYSEGYKPSLGSKSIFVSS